MTYIHNTANDSFPSFSDFQVLTLDMRILSWCLPFLKQWTMHTLSFQSWKILIF